MGEAEDYLVGPAILYNNPGITREEFVKLLSQTKLSENKYTQEDDWTNISVVFGTTTYYAGLEGVAMMLGLDKSEEYIDMTKQRTTPEGINYRKYFFSNWFPPYLYGKLDTFYVNILDSIKILGERDIDGVSWNEPFLERQWRDPVLSDFSVNGFDVLPYSSLIKKIYDYRPIFKHEKSLFEEMWCSPEFWVKMKVLDYKINSHVEEFALEEDLIKAYPQAGVDRKYVWDKEKGSFNIEAYYYNANNMCWKKIGDKYYFDESSFDNMPSSGDEFEDERNDESIEDKPEHHHKGYTDLILTAEAVKQKAWKLFSNQGSQRFLDDFFKDFPSSYKQYQQAVYDAHTSLNAKYNKKTISDFIRERSLHKPFIRDFV